MILLWTNALRHRFNFETPPAFRALEERHLFEWRPEYREHDPALPGNRYLWLNDMEWFQPNDLENFQFEPWERKGFVPFAHTAGGGYWCWWPEGTKEDRVPVLLCPRDC